MPSGSVACRVFQKAATLKSSCGTALGDKAAGKAAEKVGEKSVETVGKIWAKLRPKVEAKEAAKEAVEDLAKVPKTQKTQPCKLFYRCNWKKFWLRTPTWLQKSLNC